MTGRQLAWRLLFTLLACEPASAGSFAVNPVRVSLSAKNNSGVLVVRNDDTKSSVVQIEVVAWTQQDGKEVHTATRDILATPPIFTVAPGHSQIVRVGLRHAPDAEREVAYRVILQEVPPLPTGSNALQVALRLSVPVFVLPATPMSPVLEWHAFRNAKGQLSVSLDNTGKAHIQIVNFSLSSAAGSQPAVKQHVAAYVLPQQHREWAVQTTVPAGKNLRLIAVTDAGDRKADIVVEDRP